MLTIFLTLRILNLYTYKNQYNFTFSYNNTTFRRWDSEHCFYFILHRSSLTPIPSAIFIWITIIAKAIASWATSCSYITSTIISSLKDWDEGNIILVKCKEDVITQYKRDITITITLSISSWMRWRTCSTAWCLPDTMHFLSPGPSSRPCWNWTLAPVSACIFLIISPPLPITTPTAALGTST